MHPYDSRLERWKAVQAKLKRSEGAEPDAGRRLGSWAVEAGFEVGKVHVDE